MKSVKALLAVAALVAAQGLLAGCDQGGGAGSTTGGGTNGGGMEGGAGDTSPGDQLGAPPAGTAGAPGNPGGGGTGTGGAGGPEMMGSDFGTNLGDDTGSTPPANFGTDTENTPGASGGMPGTSITSPDADGNTAQPQTR